MSKKYKEEIDKIVMNDDMKKRILQNVLASNEINNEEKNRKFEVTVPKVKKHNNHKRNMGMVAAGFTILLCLSIAKNYPMLLKNTSNDLEQNESAKNHEDGNNDLKTSDDNVLVYNNDGKESPDNNHKEEQALNPNNNSDGSVKAESNSSSKIMQKESDTSSKTAQEKSATNTEIGKEEKNKDKLQLSSSSDAAKNHNSQNNDDKTMGNSNVSSKISPEENVNDKENNNPPGTMAKADHGDIMLDKAPENDTDSNVSITSAVAEKDANYNQEYKTLDEAEKALNLKFDSLKTLPKGFKMESISVISNEIIQVKYNDGSNNITFRGGKGVDNISGDYNTYRLKNSVNVNGLNVNLEGNKSDEYNLALWEKDGISYSILAQNGIDEKTILGMIF